MSISKNTLMGGLPLTGRQSFFWKPRLKCRLLN